MEDLFQQTVEYVAKNPESFNMAYETTSEVLEDIVANQESYETAAIVNSAGGASFGMHDDEIELNRTPLLCLGAGLTTYAFSLSPEVGVLTGSVAGTLSYAASQDITEGKTALESSTAALQRLSDAKEKTTDSFEEVKKTLSRD